ncbi:MAG: hypothetical protein ACLTSG_06185 [Lachnospiraceae bacterium]
MSHRAMAAMPAYQAQRRISDSVTGLAVTVSGASGCGCGAAALCVYCGCAVAL